MAFFEGEGVGGGKGSEALPRNTSGAGTREERNVAP